MSEKFRIKPCPFCGNNNLIVPNARGDCFVECIKCKTQGPSASSENGAIFLWNLKRITDDERTNQEDS